MVQPVEDALVSTAMADLSEMGDALASGGVDRVVDGAVDGLGVPRGHFKGGTDHWLQQSEFLDFAVRSPLPAIVSALLRSSTVRLYEDSVLVKEPGTQERTAFHQDLAYFHLTGDQICTTWVPLDTVRADTGAVRFVVGSHLDRTEYRPNLFVTTMALPGTEGANNNGLWPAHWLLPDAPALCDPDQGAATRTAPAQTPASSLTPSAHHRGDRRVSLEQGRRGRPL
jgi:hypothetical protein